MQEDRQEDSDDDYSESGDSSVFGDGVALSRGWMSEASGVGIVGRGCLYVCGNGAGDVESGVCDSESAAGASTQGVDRIVVEDFVHGRGWTAVLF